MSWKATAWAKKTTGHKTAGEKLLLMTLAEYADNKTGLAWPTETELAVDCMAAERSIRRWLGHLRDIKLITQVRRGNQHQPTIYRVNAPDIVAGTNEGAPDIVAGTNEGAPAKLADASGVPDIVAGTNEGAPDIVAGTNEGAPAKLSRPTEARASDNGHKRRVIRQGSRAAAALDARGPSEFLANFATLWEDNRLPLLAPMQIEDLRELCANKDPPIEWAKEAIRRTLGGPSRTFRYAARILADWQAQGGMDGGNRSNGNGAAGGTGRANGNGGGSPAPPLPGPDPVTQRILDNQAKGRAAKDAARPELRGEHGPPS